jgi:hypothetical protein
VGLGGQLRANIPVRGSAAIMAALIDAEESRETIDAIGGCTQPTP